MAKKIKAVRKKSASARSKKPHHPWDHHDLLLIVAGGFVVLVLIFVLSGLFPGYNIFSQATSVTAEDAAMVEQQEKTVTIEAFAYTPETIEVKTGTVITWTNNDTDAHSASADDGSFDTGLMEKGQSASVTLTEPGEYTYHCSRHPNMTGKIVVE